MDDYQTLFSSMTSNNICFSLLEDISENQFEEDFTSNLLLSFAHNVILVFTVEY